MKKTSPAGGLTIAIDASGGDAGAAMAIPGVGLACKRHDDMRFLLFGDRAVIAPLVDKVPGLDRRVEIRHCDVAVGMEDKPSQALRRGRQVSSMWQALEAVKTGQADVAVSAGNTGALMAMAKVILKTMPGVARPAIAGVWPTIRGRSIVLDIGATIGANAEQLVDCAIMGEALARCLFGLERPTVGLLNIGVEELKGTEQVRAAGQMLRATALPMEYCGFIEGSDIGLGVADVVVTEGFSGNIALKTAEGTVRQMTSYLRDVLKQTFLARLGAVLAGGAFAALRKRLDPRNYNGGLFLGLNGLVVKSHGGTDALGFANACDVAITMARRQVVQKIAADLAEKRAMLTPAATSE